MHVLLTGSSGWLGRHLSPMLEAAGYRVTGLDIVSGNATDVVFSVADGPSIDRLFSDARFDAVIHAGGLHKPDIARYPNQAFVDVNVTGTLNLLEAAAATSVSRFVFTSTTSLMISDAIRAGKGDAAIWIDESLTPIEPRNIYGVTKYAAEHLCRLAHAEHAMAVIVLRTSRFFPEDDDTHRAPPGENLKANELLHRRLTVEDAAAAHLAALDKAPEIGFGTFIVSASTPFSRADTGDLKADAAAVITRYFPDAPGIYAERGWTLPRSIDRIYDAGCAEKRLGFRCKTDFAVLLDALRTGAVSPVAHDPSYTSPLRTDRGAKEIIFR